MSKKTKVKVIIGANYGDEGKGLATHYFAQKENKENPECKIVNVLYNGGPQRGHTVDFKNDNPHIMHHLGSAFFDGAYTYFDPDFMLNPMVYIDEINKYKTEGLQKYCYIHPDCRVITPYDIFLNQTIEDYRGDNRHGSCGCGIWETKVRYQCSEYNKNFNEMIWMTDTELKEYLSKIATAYFYKRLEEYEINPKKSAYIDLIHSKGLLDHYVSDFREMAKRSFVEWCPENHAKESGLIIYEGSQGLALDCDNLRMYPHVTASKTTSEVPIERIKDIQLFYPVDVEICYVTRTYFTRHGNGYLPYEVDKSVIDNRIVDNTNVYNDYQGEIRYAYFNEKEFMDRVDKDIQRVRDQIHGTKFSLLVTHGNYSNCFDKDYFCSICRSLGIFTVYWSDTKYAEDIKVVLDV